MTYKEALAQLPAGSKWTSSFGNVGEGGFDGYFKTEDGRKFHLSNGPWNAVQPFIWALEEVKP